MSFIQREGRRLRLRALLAGITHLGEVQAITCTEQGVVESGNPSKGAQPGCVWVLRNNEQIPVQAYHMAMVNPTAAGAHVWTAKRRVTGVVEITGTFFSRNVDDYGVAVATAMTQPQVAPELNQQLFSAANLQDLRVRWPDAAFAGMYVCIEKGLTQYGYSLKQHQDISSYTPATSGTRWWVLVYEDVDGEVKFSTTGSVETVMTAGDMRLENGGDTTIAALENLTISAGWVPLSGVVLENGQTTITPSNTRIENWSFIKSAMPSSASISGITISDGSTTVTDVDTVNIVGGTLVDDGGGAVTITFTGGSGFLAHTYYGYNTIGGSNTAMLGGTAYMKKITLAAPGFLASIGVYIDHTAASNVQGLACWLMSDNAGVPNLVIGIGPRLQAPEFFITTAARWVDMPMGSYLPAGDYWCVVQRPSDPGSDLRIYFDGSGADVTQAIGNSWSDDGSQATLTTTTNKYSIRASVLS